MHRASKAAQGSAPQNRAQKVALDKALRIGEEKLLRRWATSTDKMLPTEPFTDAWQAQGGEGGAEHQVYVQFGIYYKRNNLNYHGTWLSYLHNLLLHNWLFPETGYTFLGLMDVDGFLHSVVSQKALRGIRGATPNEVAAYMLPLTLYLCKTVTISTRILGSLSVIYIIEMCLYEMTVNCWCLIRLFICSE